MLVCRLNDAIILRREMVKQRWNPMGIVSPGSPGMYEEQYYKALGKLSEHSISNVPWYNPNAKLTKVVEKAFLKQNPKDKLVFHGLNAGFTFEAILIAADAFKRAKSTDPKTLADAIRQTNITDKMTLGGPIKFNEKGQVEGIGSACVQNLQPACRPWCCPAQRRDGEAGLPGRRTTRKPSRGQTPFSMAPDLVANVVIAGVLTGLVYGLMALGLSVIFGVVRVVNFAHGEMMTIAMYARDGAVRRAQARPVPRHAAGGGGVLRLRLRACRPGSSTRSSRAPSTRSSCCWWRWRSSW